MLQVICGFVVGLLLAGLGFGLVGGGVPGLIVAVVLAALGYIAASTLTEPERRIGKMLVSALPNGQKTADTIDAANARLNSIAMLTKQVRDPSRQSRSQRLHRRYQRFSAIRDPRHLRLPDVAPLHHRVRRADRETVALLRGRGKFRRTRSDSHGTNRNHRGAASARTDRRRRTQPGGKRQDVGHYGRLRRHPTVGPHGWIRRRRTFACAFLGC